MECENGKCQPAKCSVCGYFVSKYHKIDNFVYVCNECWDNCKAIIQHKDCGKCEHKTMEAKEW